MKKLSREERGLIINDVLVVLKDDFKVKGEEIIKNKCKEEFDELKEVVKKLEELKKIEKELYSKKSDLLLSIDKECNVNINVIDGKVSIERSWKELRELEDNLNKELIYRGLEDNLNIENLLKELINKFK